MQGQRDKVVRDSNIELLRIMAMMFIIGCHLSGHGIMHLLSDCPYSNWAEGSVENKLFSSLLLPGAQIGTAVFFLISGYYGIKLKLNSFVKLGMAVIFYSVFSAFVAVVVITCGETLTDLSKMGACSYTLKSILVPLSGGAYWYITTYFVLMLISPLITKMISYISKKQYLITLLIVYLFGNVLGSFFSSDYYDLQKALLFYLIGAYISKYIVVKGRIRLLSAAIIFWLLGGIVYYIVGTLNLQGVNSTIIKIIELVHVSIITPICAVCVFCFFLQMRLKSIERINLFGGLILGVFLFHDSGVMRSIIWSVFFKLDYFYMKQCFPIYSLIVIVIVLLFGMLIEAFRIRLFGKLETYISSRLLDYWRSM